MEAAMPTAAAVNAHLAAKPDQPGAPCPPVPDVPDHQAALVQGAEAMDLPPGPDSGSKHTGPPS
jgi:hypothetical protein